MEARLIIFKGANVEKLFSSLASNLGISVTLLQTFCIIFLPRHHSIWNTHCVEIWQKIRQLTKELTNRCFHLEVNGNNVVAVIPNNGDEDIILCIHEYKIANIGFDGLSVVLLIRGKPYRKILNKLAKGKIVKIKVKIGDFVLTSIINGKVVETDIKEDPSLFIILNELKNNIINELKNSSAFVDVSFLNYKVTFKLRGILTALWENNESPG
jgi:hypothetical protein